MKKTYGNLLKPARIGNMELRNRVMMAPTDYDFVTGNYRDATFTQRLADVYKERAKGGCGLILTGGVKCEQKLDAFPKSLNYPVMDRHERIKEFANVADGVHLYGAKIAAELNAGGGRLADTIEEGEVPVSASRVITQYDPSVYTRPLTVDEIHYLTKCFGEAAAKLQAAGFDAVDVMSSGGYLIAQFLSPVWNQRKDEYGGTPEKRMRFLIECLESVKEHCGEDYPVILNLCIDEKLANIELGVLTTGEKLDESLLPDFSSNGITTEYAVQVAQEMERRNLVDAYEVRIGNYYNQEHIIPSAYSTNDEYMAAIKQFKKGVSKPVIFENKLNYPTEMQELIEGGICDFVSMGRGWIADPHWAKHAEKGEEEIRPCIRCMMCLEQLWHGKYCQCAVNPEFGHEGEKMCPALEKKKVMVIGGGAGGIQAAVTAAKRGHDVTLVEAKEKLGGRTFEAGAVTYKKGVERYGEWSVRQAEKAGIRILTGTKATKEFVMNENPDAVFIATGAEAVRPRIKGIEKAVAMEDVILEGNHEFSKPIIIGGGMIGCETAYRLWEDGTDVTVIEMLSDILMVGTSLIYRHAAVKKLRDTSVNIMTDASVVEILDDGVMLADGTKVEGDKVILAVGLRPDKTLFEELNEVVDEVYVIGDANKPGKIFHAVNDAHKIAVEL